MVYKDNIWWNELYIINQGIINRWTGSYPYHCSIHPSMTGTIVVTNGTPAANSNSMGTSGSSVGY